jgi:tRNA(fMet)-specific endonuclease VapC
MSLFVLDTDTLSLLQHNHPQVVRHVAAVAPTDIAVTIITVEEQLTGWYSALRRVRQPDEIARVYLRLTNAVRAFTSLPILTFTEAR